LRLAADGTIARTRLPDGDRPRLEDAAVAATSDGALWAWWPTLPRRFWRLPPDGTTWSPVEGPAIDATTGTVDARGGLWAATFSAVWHRAADAWTEVQLVGLPHETMVDELIATRTGAVFAMVRGGKRDLAMARDPDAAPDAHTRAEQIAAGAAFTGLVEVSSARPTLIPDVVAHHVRCVATGGGGRIAFVGRDGETTIYDPATAAVLALAAPEVPVGDCDTAAMDDAGRVWIATTRGLLVRDAAGAPTFYPRGSDPAFRTGIASVAVVGAGPALPPVAPIARGRIEGTLIGRSGRPAAGAQLVACRAVDILSHQCDDVAASVTTDPRGRFLLADLPVADWELAAFEAGASTWEVILEHRCNMTADQPCLITLEAEPE
ncbi:MAG: carboxypeptidase regulatory-like domain-containing protein, partial [Myxococcales bacterium]|nr:carboxypeptidase regulatory-like domain-containing protein [Myxococcales bacterium]